MTDNRTVSEDKKILHEMGYAQELSRSMSKFSNFAISFSIICILSGGINSFAQATSSIGGAGAGIGWIVGCLISGMFALAMAQISSAFPTAGGLYHWSSILGNRFWGYLTAWLNLLGLITVLGAINIGTAFFFAGAFGGSMGFTGTAGQVVTFVAIITVIQAALNHFGIKLTAMLTDFSGYLILATTAVLILACLAFAPAIDISRLWTFTNYSGEAGGNVFPQSDSMGYLFLLCLLLPVYTITGYDASAHTSEETVDASTSVPKSIISAVVWSSLIGWLMLSAITLAIPDMAAGAKQGWGVFFETMNAVMPGWLKQLLYLGILAAQFLCGLATVTSASRMLFAFSRDGGMPVGSEALSTVSTEYRTPVNAIWTSAVLTILYVFLAQFISIGGTNLYTIVVNSTLVFLFLSFIIPLVLGALAYGTAKWPKAGPWAMGEGLYKLVTWLSVVGMAIITYIAVQAPNEKVLWIVLGFIALAVALWHLFEKNRFKGPPMGDEIKRRQAEIATREARFGEASVGSISTSTIATAAAAAAATAAVAKAAAPSWTPPAVEKVRDIVAAPAAPIVRAPVVASPVIAAPVVATPVRVAAPVVAKTVTKARTVTVKKAVVKKAAVKKVAVKKVAVKTVKRAAPAIKSVAVARPAAKAAVKKAVKTRDTSDEAARARILKAARRGIKGPIKPVLRPVTTTIRRPLRDDEKAQYRVVSTRVVDPRDLKASSARTEDITLISGVGEVLKKRLATQGITTLSQIAAMSKTQIAALDAKMNFRGRTEREDWIAQAKELVAGGKPRAKSDRNRT